MKWGVVRFPGSLDDSDAMYALATVMGETARILWHKDTTLDGVECVLLPGGFSYGDYLRTGAIARFSPIMKSIAKFAADGGLVIGTCNGFQILGAMVQVNSPLGAAFLDKPARRHPNRAGTDPCRAFAASPCPKSGRYQGRFRRRAGSRHDAVRTRA